MRPFKNRPLYLSHWSKKELRDGLDRNPGDLLSYNFTPHAVRVELAKRKAKHDARIAAKRRNTESNHRTVEVLTVEWFGYSLADWKAKQQDRMVRDAIGLLASRLQAGWCSFDNQLPRFRQGLPFRQAPSKYAIPFFAFYKLLLPLGVQVADAGIGKVRAHIHREREKLHAKRKAVKRVSAAN